MQNATPGNHTLSIVYSANTPSGPIVHTTDFVLVVEPPRCIIATAAYGSELAAPVQFLRNFMDQSVDKRYLGHHFLTGFNAWYYSWAPPVANAELGNAELRTGVRALIMRSLGLHSRL